MVVTKNTQDINFYSAGTYFDKSFSFTIDNPQAKRYLAVLKINSAYETNGWCPVVWYHKKALLGPVTGTDSDKRTWKTT
jgi:hypothetical protein